MSEQRPDHRFVADPPTLTDPVLVVMLTGWIDASGAGAAAMSALQQQCDASPLVAFDDDLYIDYRARRPLLELRDGVSSRLVWAAPELLVGRDGAGRDVLLLHDADHYNARESWRATAAALPEVLRRIEAAGLVSTSLKGARPRQSTRAATS